MQADRVLVSELAAVFAFLRRVYLAIYVLFGTATFAAPFEGLVPNCLTCLVIRDVDEVLVHPGSVDFHCIGVDEAGGGGRGVRCGPAHRGALERVVEVHNEQVGVATLRNQFVVRGGAFRVVVQPFDVLGGKSALETIEEVLLGPASAGCPGFEIREVVGERAVALFHCSEHVLGLGDGILWLEFRLEEAEEFSPIVGAYDATLFVGNRGK